MWNVRRQDLGTDIVVLPQRSMVVFHPGLDYAEALGALLAAMPDMHIDVAKAVVEKVTPTPRPEKRRWPGIFARMSISAAIAAVATAVFAMFAVPAPANAMPEFGPIWSNEIARLGISCEPTDQPDVRDCTNEDGATFEIGGARHETGTLYASTGPDATMIFVFDNELDAIRYAALHEQVTRDGRAVVW